MQTLFNLERRRWYATKNQRTGESLSKYYIELLFDSTSVHDCTDALIQSLGVSQFDSPGKVIFDGREIASPTSVLCNQVWGEFSKCIIHGDLNCENIFVSTVSEQVRVTLIDFASTTLGHVFLDFVVLEIAIRLSSPDWQALDPLSIIRLEDQVCNPTSEPVEQVVEVLQTVRTLAVENFPNEPIEYYYYAIAAYALSLSISDCFEAAERKTLAVLLFSAIEQIEKLRGS